MRASRLVTVICLLCWGAAGALAQTRAVLVAGLGGIPEYEDRFVRQAQALAGKLEALDVQTRLVTGARVSSTEVKQLLFEAGGGLGSNDELMFIFVGHGSHDGERFRFNVPGPDFTATELSGWLEEVPAWQLVVLACSASGGALDTLAHERRTLVSATRSGGQGNVSVFARYLIEALEAEAADTNKDRRVSLEETFAYASAAVAEHYESRRLMATEHPQMVNASRGFMLARLGSVEVFDQSLAADLALRTELEESIDALKTRKDALSTDAYFVELQRLLLELALVEKRLADGRADPGGGP